MKEAVAIEKYLMLTLEDPIESGTTLLWDPSGSNTVLAFTTLLETS